MPAVAFNEHSAKPPSRIERESSKDVTATRELRVLQIFDGLGMGGAETWLMSLLKYFQAQNEHAASQVSFDVLLTGGERRVFDTKQRR